MRTNAFEEYLQTRLNQFRGINKEKLFSYLKESQIRYNSSPTIVYQKLLSNLQKQLNFNTKTSTFLSH